MTEIVVKGAGESEKAVNVCCTRNGVSNDLSPNLEGNSRDDADGLIFAGCHGGELTSRSLTVVVILSDELKQWKERGGSKVGKDAKHQLAGALSRVK